MKNLVQKLLIALTLLISLRQAAAQGTAFTYQGRLNTNAVPASGFFDFEFYLYPNAAGTPGTMLAGLTQTNVGVTNGLFTVTLNFGNYFTGNPVWLAISARSNGVGNYTALSPLQELNPTPYSIFANTASNLSGTLPVGQLSGAIPLAQLPPGLVTNDESGVTLSNVTVQGNLNLPSPATIDSGGNAFLYADNQDNIFAGINSGNGPLSGYYNTAIGADTLINITGGYYNTASGFQALQDNTTGELNTGIGVQALWFNTTGIFNTAIGVDALFPNTNGSYNTALGVNALAGSASGSNNIGIGYGAGQGLGTGGSNIDIGHPGLSSDNMTIRIGNGQTATYLSGVIYGNGAGLTNLPGAGLVTDPGTLNFFAGVSAGNGSLSGYYNTGVGYDTLVEDTTGVGNSAQGFESLFDNSAGSFNTANGVYALAYNTTGSNNTATGAYALSAVNAPLFVVGSGNTADGAYALEGNEGGYNNTGVGFQALQNNTNGFDNVAVGVNALLALNSGSVNSLNTAVGTYTFSQMTSGYYNTGIGAYSFYELTNGGFNTAIGNFAGYYLSSGSDNIYIGNYGEANDNDVIRIGQGQTATYIGTEQTFIDGCLALDGSTTNNGLVYTSASGLPGNDPGGNGVFLYGYNGGALGSVGPGEVSLSWDYVGNVWISNNLSTLSLTIRGGSDLAEPFKITPGKGELPDGSVMVIDDTNPGRLKVSSEPYDTRVAGILSGANGVHPGISMQQDGLLEGDRNVALTGRVYVQADASNGPIKPGDLLTTSSNPGRAMKVTDHVRAHGAILGKAMSGLSEGNGMVLVLVTLQ